MKVMRVTEKIYLQLLLLERKYSRCLYVERQDTNYYRLFVLLVDWQIHSGHVDRKTIQKLKKK